MNLLELQKALEGLGAVVELGNAGKLKILSNADIPQRVRDAIREHKSAIALKLELERSAHLCAFIEQARRFLGNAEADVGALHAIYLDSIPGGPLRFAGVGQAEFEAAFRATPAPTLAAPAVELDAAFEEEHGERAAIMEHDGGLSKACAEAWVLELRHLEQHGRKLARAPVACRLKAPASFVDVVFPVGAVVQVIPAGAPLDALSSDDAEWLRHRLERLHKLRRDARARATHRRPGQRLGRGLRLRRASSWRTWAARSDCLSVTCCKWWRPARLQRAIQPIR